MHKFKFQMSTLCFLFECMDGARGALVEMSILGGAGKGLFDVESPKSASGLRSWILRDGGMNVTCFSLSVELAVECV